MAYPNWVFASDEETEPGQDETTIRPEAQQAFISDETDCTAARATLANGQTAIAFLSILNRKIETINIHDGNEWWSLRGDYGQVNWVPVIDTRSPEGPHWPLVRLSDPNIFPIRVVSVLASMDGFPIVMTVPRSHEIHRRARKSWFKFWQ